ncbi:substrate-binding periplasmic protein [Motiliproteus sp.]|uniref:substrate-binding periplasmic protein n=1 Tax=Motiliproteus sp. TaxID=1898955 RepID=UPI003BA96B69
MILGTLFTRRSRVQLFLLITALLPASLMAGQTTPDPVRILTLQDFKPFIWCEEGTPKGIDIDIIRVLFERAQRSYTLECQPWKRALNLIKTGRADMLLSAYKTEERQQFAYFSSLPIHLSSFNLFTPRGQHFKFTGIESLNGYRIGIPAGYSLGAEFDAASKAGAFKVSPSYSTESGLMMLLKGRIDLYIDSKQVVRYTANQIGLNEAISMVQQPLSKPRPAYFMFSKASTVVEKQNLLAILDESLAQVWSDGTMERIVKAYTHPDSHQESRLFNSLFPLVSYHTYSR